MERRDFIFNSSVFMGGVSMFGGTAFSAIFQSDQIVFPEEFSQAEKDHVNELFNEMKHHSEGNGHRKVFKAFLEPRQIIKRDKDTSGKYYTIYKNKIGNTITLKREKGERITHFA